MKDDRAQRMDIARTAARLASVALEEGERNFQITQAVIDLSQAIEDWKGKACSLASSGG